MESPKEAYFKLCDLYLLSSDKQRGELRRNDYHERNWEIPDCQALAARLPGEPDREARSRAFLIALSFLEGDETRDLLSLIRFPYFSLKDMGKDADAWLRYFADLSSPPAASALDNFASRPPEGKTLEAWALTSEVTTQGIIYRDTL